MGSLINALQSFISWLYSSVTNFVNFFNRLYTWVSSFLNQVQVVLNVCLPPWLFVVIWAGLALMLVFLIVKVVVNLL